MTAFVSALAFTIGYGVPGYGEEGGEADNPDDPGGFTWRGITLYPYRVWINNPGFTATQLIHLTENQIVSYYRACYWNAIAGDRLPAAIAIGVFDFAVNAGPFRAAVTLQHAVGADEDGAIGPMTLAAVEACNITFLIGRYTELRHSFYTTLVEYPEFGAGWDARTYACETAMTALLPTSSANFHAILAALPRRGQGAQRPRPVRLIGA